ncbi:SAM-dependent methyltransferase [Xylanimonas ulmi]|uniref:Tetrapyrrole (Corrin/porphyrin) methylase-like protein n=1 Tax=Xylanimonas ulmi TaxID=228973 RepID=A0A4Q7M1S3_9MICO|nr:SAM-dependent methyltransferase [Xylanibacterium ulmi]RZS60532.1 tetrapyrrole (corrin/porphyrin) methylase-like protein [Xylanibacterium ulmi]
MATTQNVDVSLEYLVCHDEGDGWGTAEPYLWACYFKVDGDNYAVQPGSGLIGAPLIDSRTGGHGNLGNTDVDAGDAVAIPEGIGFWHTKLKPIPVNDPFVRGLVGENLPGIIGVIVVAMEEDGWPNSLAEAGYQAFVDGVYLGVTKVAASFQHALSKPTKEQIDAAIATVKASVGALVKAAVKNAMSGWQLIWYGTFGDNDDQIGSEAFTTDSDELATSVTIPISRRWGDDEAGDGDWELQGRIRGLPDITCSLESLFSSFAATDTGTSMDDLRAFRDGPFRTLPGLGAWWDEFQTLAPALVEVAADNPRLQDALTVVLQEAARTVSHPDAELSADLLDNARTVIDSLDGHVSARGAKVLRQAATVLERIHRLPVERAIETVALSKPIGRTPRTLLKARGDTTAAPLTAFLLSLTSADSLDAYERDPQAVLRASALSPAEQHAVRQGLRGWLRLQSLRELEAAGLAAKVSDQLPPDVVAIDPITINTNNFNANSITIETHVDVHSTTIDTTHITTTDATTTTTNSSDWRDRLTLNIDDAIRHFERTDWDSPGRLVVVGSGIRPISDLTLGARDQIIAADVVVYCVADPITELQIHELNPNAHSLYGLYGNGKPRIDTYREMVEAMLTPLREGKRVCAVFYGHPGIFAWATHESIRQARAAGLRAEMAPAISSQDSLFADLGIDPSSAGLQTVDATDLLIRRRQLNPTMHVLIWQAECVGDDGFNFAGYERHNFPILIEYLQQTYPSDHTVVIYDASTYPHLPPTIRSTTLDVVDAQDLSGISTLYLPPAFRADIDQDMLHRLGLE